MDYREPAPRQKQQAASWMIIFGDLAALLLTFFVMIFAMSDVPSERWEAVIATLSTSFDGRQREQKTLPQAEHNVATVELDSALDTGYLSQVLHGLLDKDDVLKGALLHMQGGRLVVSLPGHLLFPPGEAAMSLEARQAVFRLGGVVSRLENQVEVRGHADPTVADGADFSAAWALSLERAMAVSRELVASGYGRDILVIGLGDSRFAHLSGSIPEARRRELSRRVDVVIHPTAAER